MQDPAAAGVCIGVGHGWGDADIETVGDVGSGVEESATSCAGMQDDIASIAGRRRSVEINRPEVVMAMELMELMGIRLRSAFQGAIVVVF